MDCLKICFVITLLVVTATVSEGKEGSVPEGTGKFTIARHSRCSRVFILVREPYCTQLCFIYHYRMSNEQ